MPGKSSLVLCHLGFPWRTNSQSLCLVLGWNYNTKWLLIYPQLVDLEKTELQLSRKAVTENTLGFTSDIKLIFISKRARNS